MPYINVNTKKVLNYSMSKLKENFIWYGEKSQTGVLNYVFTSLILRWLGDKPNYAKYNEVIGVLECVKLEFYRRAVSVYEDSKLIENGDVYSEEEETSPH